MTRAYILALALIGATAQAAAPTGQLPLKLDYAEGVIMNARNMAHIQESGNEEAKNLLSMAQDEMQQARKAQQDGDFEAADKLTTSALKHFTSARSKAPREDNDLAYQKRRYQDLQKQVETYKEWSHSSSQLDASTQAEMDHALAEIEKAAQFAAKDDYTKANEFLGMALNIIIKVKNDSLKVRTFSYDLNFETAIDEYKYELSRNDDYLRLLPVAISQRQPSPGIQNLMTRYADQATIKRHDAEMMFAQKQFEKAVAALQDSTKDLVNALKIAGVR